MILTLFPKTSAFDMLFSRWWCDELRFGKGGLLSKLCNGIYFCITFMAHVREWYLPVKLSIPVIMHDCPCYFPCKLLWPCNLLMMVIPSPCSKWKTVLDVVTICSSPFSFASHLLDQWGLLQYTYRTGRFASIDIPRPLREIATSATWQAALGGTTQLPGLIGTWGDASIFDTSCDFNDLEEFRYDHNDQGPHSGLYQMLRHVACWRCTALYTLYRHFFLVSNYGISWLCSCYTLCLLHQFRYIELRQACCRLRPALRIAFNADISSMSFDFFDRTWGTWREGAGTRPQATKTKVKTDGTNHAQGGGCIQNRLSHAPWVGDHVRSCYLAHGVSLV